MSLKKVMNRRKLYERFKKMIVGAVLYTLLYIGIIYASTLSGIYSPVFLGICFVGFFCVCRDSVSVFDRQDGRSSVLEHFLHFLWQVLARSWEKGTILNWGLILLDRNNDGRVFDCAIGNKRIAGVRISYLPLALIPFGRTIVIWTDRTKEIAEQAAEMGKAYGDTMEAITPIWMLVVMIIITVVVAFLAERMVEKCMKKSVWLMDV
ncbi:MAG: MptD family putative ECF transporter S component [Anaerobutyricum sp.]